MNDNNQYNHQNNNAHIEELDEDEDGVYQDNDEGGDDEIDSMQNTNPY